ncbi:MAG: hypothetical protein LBT09_08215 [Planctomycetaceae bacterium]|jgi:hypothetical protein|nr:hypothetical protein [Planctomycetaceae bacterium]
MDDYGLVQQLENLGLKYPLLGMIVPELPSGIIRDGQIESDFIPNGNSKLVTDAAKRNKVTLQFHYRQCNGEQQLLVYDLINTQELTCQYPRTGEHARLYYTAFNERYVRYCEWCWHIDPEERLLVPLQYQLCLSQSDLLEIGFGTFASNGNTKKLYVRDPKSYDWDCKLIV